MQLKPGSLLQGGKYRIIRTLGQGGFGITYEAEQVLLKRKVALKEFFMKDCCERDESTSNVTVGTGSQKALVAKFKDKFIREAQMMAGMNHPNIVRVIDVFEENGTAYYVMEAHNGGSLKDKVEKEGPMVESQAVKYIKQVAAALAYIHSRNTVHLDVKPSNVLLDENGDAILIDFGISKHYDKSGEQTSSTPVGISKGYAPLEQGRDGDVSQFQPSTDIYALGATLYYLVSGKVPPEASIVNEDGLSRPKGISDRIWSAIEQAMQPRRKDRPQDIASFLSLMDNQAEPPVIEVIVDDEKTEVPLPKTPEPEPVVKPKPELSGTSQSRRPKTWLWALLSLIAAAVLAFILFGGRKNGGGDTPVVPPDSTVVAAIPEPVPEPAVEQPGSIKFTSEPSGASIWLNGKNTGKKTPDILEDIAPGKHAVRLVLDGYNEYKGNVTVTSGKRTELNRTLDAKPAPSDQKEAPASSQTQPTGSSAGTSASATRGTINSHEWVDLGLSVKWATTNVGASSPSDYGSYFAWGETRPKNEYTWESYAFRVTGDEYVNVTFSKYNTESTLGSVDNKKRLERGDDAARANWGGSWRMPTQAEQDELRTKCTWTWTTLGGKNGYKVTSKTNGNSIFLPAAGSRYDTILDSAGSYGFYWSSSLYTDGPGRAWYVTFNSGYVRRSFGDRYVGQSVRPVTE